MRLPFASFFPALLCSVLLTGCSIAPTAVPSPEAGPAIHGLAYGGNQPVIGGHVYLFAAGTSGYGGASTSLLNSASTGYSDSIGAYVPTGTNGTFTITGDYTCTSGTQVYIYILGGNSGGGANSALGLLGILGQCPSGGSLASAVPFALVDEVTTIAAAYAFAGFATDATHVSSSGTALAQKGIANAFANAANLADIATGAALATTPAGNGVVPQSEINTLANILALCVNSADANSAISSNCSTLFGYALSAGTTGTTPTDTATAAINIAHNPGSNVASLYGNPTPTSPFTPTLGGQPNDFTVAIGFNKETSTYQLAVDGSGNIWATYYNEAPGVIYEISSTGVSEASGGTCPGSAGVGCYTYGTDVGSLGIAIDSNGYVWVANRWSNSVTEFSSSGTMLSTSAGYTASSLSYPNSIAVDASNNIWVVSSGADNLTEFSNSGSLLSGTGGYSIGPATYGSLGPVCTSIDSSGNAWVANTAPNVVEFSNSGNIVSPTLCTTDVGYTGGGLEDPTGMALDASGNVWIADNYNRVVKFSSSGSALSPSTGYTGGGLKQPVGIAVDGAGNVWVSNNNTYVAHNPISEFNNSGTAISPSTGYTAAALGAENGGIVVDGSGNVWVAASSQQSTYGSIVEFVGVATPVVTPLVTGIKNNTLGTRP